MTRNLLQEVRQAGSGLQYYCWQDHQPYRMNSERFHRDESFSATTNARQTISRTMILDLRTEQMTEPGA